MLRRPRRSAAAANGRRCTAAWAATTRFGSRGPGRRHYRLFCLLDNGSAEELAERGFECPQIAVINGMVKDHMTEFSDAEYRANVRDLGDDYLATLPRRIANDANED